MPRTFTCVPVKMMIVACALILIFLRTDTLAGMLSFALILLDVACGSCHDVDKQKEAESSRATADIGKGNAHVVLEVGQLHRHHTNRHCQECQGRRH